MRAVASVTGFVFLAVLAVFAGVSYRVGSLLVAPHRPETVAVPPGLPVNEISFASDSGSTLSGWFVDPDQSCGVVVLMHGVRADKWSMVNRARFLFEAGYAVLLFDFQAHGESGGENITFGYLERKDAAAAVRYARRAGGQAAVAVIGVSLGGVAAVLNGAALGADAVILESVYPTLKQALANRIRLHAGDLGPVTRFLLQALLIQLKPRLGFRAEQLRPIDHIAALGRPLLMIAGSKDRHTTLSDSRALYDQAREPKDLWLIEGARHVDFHRHDPQGYADRVLGFLREHTGCP